MRKKIPRLSIDNPKLWAQLQELRRPLESTQGHDPDLRLLLDWPLRDEAKLPLASLIALILRKDGPVTVDTNIIICSPKREVIIAPFKPGGKMIVAVLTGPQMGTRRRVDHELGVNRYRDVLEELQRLKKALKDSDEPQKVWDTVRKRFPVAVRLDSRNLAGRFRNVVKQRLKSSEPLERIAAELVYLENPGIPKPSVILRDAGTSQFSRRRRAPRSK